MSDTRIYLVTVANAVDSTVPTGDLFYFKNVEFLVGGAITVPKPQPIPVVDDASGIGTNPGRVIGATYVGSDRTWRVVAPSTTSGNEQLLGGTVFDVPGQHRIDSWVVTNLGAATRTISLGNTSGGTAYGASLTVPVGRTDITPASRFPGTGNLWVNSDGSDRLVHTIRGQVLGNN